MGLKLSELSELPVPGSLAAWLPGSLMALWLPGSRAAWAPGRPETRPREDPADPGSGGQKRTGLQPQAVWKGGGQAWDSGVRICRTPPPYKAKALKQGGDPENPHGGGVRKRACVCMWRACVCMWLQSRGQPPCGQAARKPGSQEARQARSQGARETGSQGAREPGSQGAREPLIDSSYSSGPKEILSSLQLGVFDGSAA